MAEEVKKEKKEKKELKDIRYVDKIHLQGKNKLYSCNVVTGKMEHIKLKKQYFRATKTGAITVELYFEVMPATYYIIAEGVKDAIVRFQKIFDELDKAFKDTDAQGEEDVVAKQDVLIIK